MFRQFLSHPIAVISALLVTLVVMIGLARLAAPDGALHMLTRVGQEVTQQVIVVGHRVVQQVIIVGQRLKGQ